jgi:hypothetical protein
MSFHTFSLKTARDEREFLGEGFDRPMHDSGRFEVAVAEQSIKALLGQHVAGLIVERVMAEVAQWLAPILDEGAERALAGAVAHEALVILELHIIVRDLDGGQPGGAVGSQCRHDRPLIGHQ